MVRQLETLILNPELSRKKKKKKTLIDVLVHKNFF